MNYKRIPEEHDARRKLTEEDRDAIRRRYKDPHEPCSQRSLAREYGVSRRLITFIVDPDKLEQNRARRRERIDRGEQPHYWPKSAEYMRRHRARRRELLGEEAGAYDKALREKSRRYFCKPCEYGPVIKSTLARHKLTKKHKRNAIQEPAK